MTATVHNGVYIIEKQKSATVVPPKADAKRIAAAVKRIEALKKK